MASTPPFRGVGLGLRARPAARRWRFWVALAVIVGLVGAVLVAIFSHAPPMQTASNSSLHPVEITPASDLIDCPTDLAWSPDLQMIAVVGYATACPSPDTVYGAGFSDVAPALYQGPLNHIAAGYVAVYDTRHVARIAAFSPDSTILQAIGQQALFSPAFSAWLATAGVTPEQYLAIHYTHVVWASDHQRLIVTFTCYLPDGPPISTAVGKLLPGHIAQGLLISDVSGQRAQVLLQVGGQQSAGTVIWDLTAARAIGMEPASAPFSLQPAALSYSWDSSGALVPHRALSASAPPVGAGPDLVGAPLAGASSFAIWQPGMIATTINTQRPGEPGLKGVTVFATDTAALSPDGHYLATSVGLAGLVIAPSSSTVVSLETLAQYGWQAAPRLPLRDAGLRHAIALAEQSGFSAAAGAALSDYAQVAWRPDGHVIAVSANSTGHAVTLFDCVSGKQIGVLTPPAMAASTANAGATLLAWSPDGRQLAFYDSYSGTLTLWSSAFLPT